MLGAALLTLLSLTVGFALGETSRFFSRRAEARDRRSMIEGQLLLDTQDALGAMSRVAVNYAVWRKDLLRGAGLPTLEQRATYRAALHRVHALGTRITDAKTRQLVDQAWGYANDIETAGTVTAVDDVTKEMGDEVAEAIESIGATYRKLLEP